MSDVAATVPVTLGPDLGVLRAEVTRLAAEINSSTYRFLELVRELDECDGWAESGQKSCAHWLNWQCGIDLGAAREQVRVAYALKELPEISEAFRGGRVSYSKVRALTRVATAEDEKELLSVARDNTASDVERIVRDYRKRERSEALEAENRRHEERSLRFFVDDEGFWVLKGRFTPEQGTRIQQALEAAMEDAYQEQKEATQESAEGLSDEGQPAPFSARCADALARVAEGYLSGDAADASGGDRCTLHVHTTRETLRADGEGAEAELEQGGALSAETSRRLACDSAVVHWEENASGATLNVGRKTRSVPPAIRRALQRRDGGCRFPGCTAVRFVDAHHIQHWADGGATRLDNLVLLCRHHHRLIHEGGFGVSMNGQGAPVFNDPNGVRLEAAPEIAFRGNVSEPIAVYDREGLLEVGSFGLERFGWGCRAGTGEGVSVFQRE